MKKKQGRRRVKHTVGDAACSRFGSTPLRAREISAATAQFFFTKKDVRCRPALPIALANPLRLCHFFIALIDCYVIGVSVGLAPSSPAIPCLVDVVVSASSSSSLPSPSLRSRRHQVSRRAAISRCDDKRVFAPFLFVDCCVAATAAAFVANGHSRASCPAGCRVAFRLSSRRRLPSTGAATSCDAVASHFATLVPDQGRSHDGGD